jgi:hypothetical protein
MIMHFWIIIIIIIIECKLPIFSILAMTGFGIPLTGSMSAKGFTLGFVY